MDNPNPVRFVPVSDVVASLLGITPKRVRPIHIKECTKRFGLTVSGQFPYGRGYIHMVDKAHADELIAKHAPPKPDPATDAESPAELHLGALEAKVDRLEATLRSNSEAINLLIKQNNILTDRLDRVLKELGAAV